MLIAPLNKLEPMQEKIIEFKGLNKKSVIGDGEFSDMKNLSSDEYPCLYQRKGRGEYPLPAECKVPYSLIQKRSKLGIIAEDYEGNVCFFYDNFKIQNLTGLSEDSRMVAINSRICFFPENLFYNVVDGSIGSLAANLEDTATPENNIGALTITIDDEAGTARISKRSEGAYEIFKEDDVVEVECTLKTEDGKTFTFSGDTYIDENNLPRLSTKVMGFTEGDILLESAAFLNIYAAGYSSASVYELKIKRFVPKLDYVMESNNRLWGVSNESNTIYASKLGDPTNWQYYQGTSMDSYYAEQGTDGEWTGCAAYSNHLLFFKEHYIHKVYGTSPSSYQITTTQCYGLEKGSSRSVAIVNDMVLFKSQIGIMAYEGDAPYCVSQKFGNNKFDNVVAGTNGLKYYASIHNVNTGLNWMLVCDIDKALWHKEDNVRVRDFCFFNGKLLFICDGTTEYFEANKLYIIDADKPLAREETLSWWAELGPFDEFEENKKIYSKVDMRIEMPQDTILDFYIKMDNGDWEYLNRKTHEHGLVITQTFTPRRCDKFSIRIEGMGKCKLNPLEDVTV